MDEPDWARELVLQNVRRFVLEATVCGVCGSGHDEHLLLLCEDCEAACHTFCLDPPLNAVPAQSWYCARCATQRAALQQWAADMVRNNAASLAFAALACEVCRLPDRAESMLVCDSCNRGFHMSCLTPPLEHVPDGDWLCVSCARVLDIDSELSASGAEEQDEQQQEEEEENLQPQRRTKRTRRSASDVDDDDDSIVQAGPNCVSCHRLVSDLECRLLISASAAAPAPNDVVKWPFLHRRYCPDCVYDAAAALYQLQALALHEFNPQLHVPSISGNIAAAGKDVALSWHVNPAARRRAIPNPDLGPNLQCLLAFALEATGALVKVEPDWKRISEHYFFNKWSAEYLQHLYRSTYRSPATPSSHPFRQFLAHKKDMTEKLDREFEADVRSIFKRCDGCRKVIEGERTSCSACELKYCSTCAANDPLNHRVLHAQWNTIGVPKNLRAFYERLRNKYHISQKQLKRRITKLNNASLPLYLGVTFDGATVKNGFSLFKFYKTASPVDPQLGITEFVPANATAGSCRYSLSICPNFAGVLRSNDNSTPPTLLGAQNGCAVLVSDRTIAENGNFSVATSAWQAGYFFANVLISPVAGCAVRLESLSAVCDKGVFGSNCATLGGAVDGTIVAPGQTFQWSYTMPATGMFGPLTTNFSISDVATNATSTGLVSASVTLNGLLGLNGVSDFAWMSGANVSTSSVSFSYANAERTGVYVFQVQNQKSVPVVISGVSFGLTMCIKGEGPGCAWVSPLVFFDASDIQLPFSVTRGDNFCVGDSCSYTIYAKPPAAGSSLEFYVNSSAYTLYLDWMRIPFAPQISTSVTTDGWYVTGLVDDEEGLFVLKVTLAPGINEVAIPVRFTNQGSVQTTAAGNGGLSSGQIAGIVIGTLAGVALILGVSIFLIRRKRKQEYRTL